MGSIKLKIHPLFIVFGVYCALTSKLLSFVVCSLTAVVHELGHSIIAGERGYKLNKIMLMPFGAVVTGDFDKPCLVDDIAISIAGPILNLLIALIFVAFWWIEPMSYPYTEEAVQTNLSMAVINLLPAKPLDGGRILYAILSLKINKKVAKITCEALGLVLSIILLGAFVYSIFNTLNVSILFFSLFVFFGTINKDKENRYVRIYNGVSQRKLKLGVSLKRFAIDKSASLKRLAKILDADALNEVVVLDNKKVIATLTQEEISKILSSNRLNEKIYDCINI